MDIDFSSLSSLDLSDNTDNIWGFSYTQAKDFIGKCESYLSSSVNFTGYHPKIIDSINDIINSLYIITERIDSTDETGFKEIIDRLTEENPIVSLEKQLLKARLTTLTLSCVSILQGDNLVKEYTSKKRELEKAISDLQKDVDNCNKKINQAYNDAEQNVNSILQIANTQLANAQKALTDSQTAVADSKTKLTASEGALAKAEEALVKAEEKLNNIEHDMLTHVLTLMGVFSAVITIFMSLVITSTAWLNNADGASAVLAFVVPSAVAVVAVASLLLIIFVYHNATTGSDNHPIKVSPAYIVLIVFFAILAGSLVHISTSYSQKCTPDHIHTILTESDYRIGVEPKPDGSIVNVYLQFTLDGKNYWFDYNEEYIHNGNLYFCQEHKRLE